MEAKYILSLVEAREEDILALPTSVERMKLIIGIAKNASFPPETTSEFAFMATMNFESDALIQLCEMYEKSGRCLVEPNNSFSEIEANNVRYVINRFYDLCEHNIKKEKGGEKE